MTIIVISFLIFLAVAFSASSFGYRIHAKVESLKNIDASLLGFIVLIGLLSIVEILYFNFDNQVSILFNMFLGIIIAIIVFGIKNFKINLSIKKLIIVFGFIGLIILISLQYRLGEQMGDNTYLMNMVSMNNIRAGLNTTTFGNGFYYGTNIIGSNKAYLSWYHFFSFLTFYAQKLITWLKFDYIPSALLFVWVGNLLFYFYSAVIGFKVIELFKIKTWWIKIAVFILMIYWGTVYYNLVLGHYGSNFVSIFVIALWMMFYQIDDLNYKSVSVIILSNYAIASMGNVGFISAAYVLFAYVLYQIFKKNQNIFKWIPLLFIPIFHWMFILNDIIPAKWLLPSVALVPLISLIIHNVKPLREFIFKYILYIVLIVLMILYGISILKVDNYLVLFKDFFAIKSNFDRLQDFFSFVNLHDSLRNIAYYSAMASLFINDKTKKVGWMVLIILLFFINPIVYPLLYPPLQWLYHRAYISAFNIFIIMLGVYALFDYLLRKKGNTKYVFMISWMLLLVPSIYLQTTGYFNLIYKSGPDFNWAYKLDNSEIEVLEKLRQIVDIEGYENAKVVSQIYATTMYVPQVYQMYFNFANHRIYDTSTPDESYDPLYRIFYTPVYEGDDGPRLNAPIHDTCTLLIDNKVDFIIYDKTLSVYDKEVGDWISTYWYARDCAEEVMENDRFILYRFYWK